MKNAMSMLTVTLGFIAATACAAESAPDLAVPKGFTTDVDAAMKRAAARGVRTLVLFTGSDWCVWCKKLAEEVLSTPEFLASATGKYELACCDFPSGRRLPDALKRRNEALKERYGVTAFPTVAVLDVRGNLETKLSYKNGGAEKWLAYAESEIASAGLVAKYLKPFDDEYNEIDDKAFADFKIAEAAIKGVEGEDARLKVWKSLLDGHLAKARDFEKRLSKAEMPDSLSERKKDLLESIRHVAFALEHMQ